MSSEELDALVTEHGIEVPEEWPTLNVEAKRDWLKSQFEEAPAAEAAQPVEVAGQVEDETKPAKKKASKSKAVAAPALQGEVVQDDMLADLVHEIENMKEKQALELVGTLAEQTEVTFFKLGGVLSRHPGEWLVRAVHVVPRVRREEARHPLPQGGLLDRHLQQARRGEGAVGQGQVSSAGPS